jgi:hypothetical protein
MNHITHCGYKFAQFINHLQQTINISFDGQWYKMTVRDGNDSPLTILQSQKQIWNSMKKIDKKDILKEISLVLYSSF